MSRPVPLVPLALAVGLLTLSGFAAGVAQTASNAASAHRLTQSRTDLQELLRRLVGMAETRRYDKGVSPEFVRVETTYIRRRLAEGDFHAGDRILVLVEMAQASTPASAAAAGRTSEQQLSDTFTVGSSQEVTLPVVGVVSLRGVLRTELEPRLTEEIARYIRDPVVRARALVGLTLSGELATRPRSSCRPSRCGSTWGQLGPRPRHHARGQAQQDHGAARRPDAVERRRGAPRDRGGQHGG